MNKMISGAMMATLALTTVSVAAEADARPRRYQNQARYKSQDCIRFNKTTGAVAGGVAGGVLGHVIGGGLGTAVGAVAGGVAGHELANNRRKDCRR